MKEYDFEVHIAFPKEQYSKTAINEQFPGEEWDIRPVITVAHVTAKKFIEHGVRGELGWLITQHTSSLDKAIEISNKIGEKYKGNTAVRVEIEQVLSVTCLDEAVSKLIIYDYTLAVSDFSKLSLVSNFPSFEVHHCFSPEQCESKDISVDQITDWSVMAEFDIDEVVLFGAGRKITTTKFFSEIKSVEDELFSLNQKIEDKLVKAGHIKNFKIVAERIIAVGAPFE